MSEYGDQSMRQKPEYDKNSEKRRNVAARVSLASVQIVTLIATLALGRIADGQSIDTDLNTGMEQAIAHLNEARTQFKKVRDYECLLIKRENVNGTLLPKSVMKMKARTKPFSIYLRAESPDDEKGLEVSYVEGRNKGMMRVHPAGILGILSFWSVDPYDARAFKKNRHCIKEAGLGNLLESTARYWEMERRLNKTIVRITDEKVAGITCTRIETIHPDRKAGTFYGYRCVLWLDKSTHLPVGADTYDWPRPGGPKGGDLLESYRYLNVRCNVGLGDDAFPQ